MAYKILPISLILDLKSESFEKYLIKPELIMRLFYFFNPFEMNSNLFENKFMLKKKIVEKIYTMS